MAALPYIQLYVADYLADTVHLTTEQHGAYLMIIFNYWQTGKPIPENRMPGITRLTPEKWAEYRDLIAEFFEINDGIWHHNRIEADLSTVMSQQQQRVAAGKKSAKTRRAQAAEKQRDFNGRSTTAEQALNEGGERSLNDTDTYTNTQTDTNTKKTTTTGENSSAKTNNCPYQKILDLYHEILPNNPRCAKLSSARKAQIAARWKNDIPKLESWEKYFRYIAKSEFLTGRTPPSPGKDKPFNPGIDWLTKEANMLKIIEKNYHD